MTLGEKVSFIWRLPRKRKIWLAGCLISSILTLPIIYILPSKSLRYFLGHSLRNTQLCALATQQQLIKSRQISSLMTSVAANTPWPCLCLAQALCLRWLFFLEKIPSVIYLGTARENGAFKAHAWVCVGPLTVIGQHKGEYSIVGTFTSTDFSTQA